MTEDPYLYPGTNVLRNKLELRDLTALDRAERRLVAQRVKDGIPRGDFDLEHLKAIHKHLSRISMAGQERSAPSRFPRTGTSSNTVGTSRRAWVTSTAVS